eukprot:6196588-Pleurochrysis_carterae.AAC.2
MQRYCAFEWIIQALPAISTFRLAHPIGIADGDATCQRTEAWGRAKRYSTFILQCQASIDCSALRLHTVMKIWQR